MGSYTFKHTREWYKSRIEALEAERDELESKLFEVRCEKWKYEKRALSLEQQSRQRFALWERQIGSMLLLLERVAHAKINKELKQEINEYIREYSSTEEEGQ